MKLAYAEMSGFRGFRQRARVEFGEGFTILCGRNGVGKSTLFDCIEFALTGTINKYEVEKAAKESLADYIWWRGAGEPAARYVKIGFVGADGEVVEIERSRESGASHTTNQIELLLCTANRPDGALAQLCKTSIIRDEWIAALSVDLSETERFELVRAALGPAEGADLLAKIKSVNNIADTKLKNAESAYEAVRAQLTIRLSQTAGLRDTISKAGDIAAALVTIHAELPSAPTETIDLLNAGRAALSQRKSKLDYLAEAAHLGHEIALRRLELMSPGGMVARQTAEETLNVALEANDIAQNTVRAALEAFQREEEANQTAAHLMSLLEHGQKLGLHDGNCPLCAAHRTMPEFESGLAIGRARVALLAAGLPAARERLVAAQNTASEPAQRVALAQMNWQEHSRQIAALAEMEQAHVEFFENHGLVPTFASDPQAMDREIEDERDRLINLEAALRTLEASQGISQLTSLEEQIAELRRESDKVAKDVSRAREAVATAHAMERSVRRVSAEIVDERLAQISPLLNELYQRLRPHADWRTIEYSIRGDVRRFLSLRVGDGLNPQFVFSSGQRRAAGLAFLLSVHLSRAWTKWDTLLLDDPVQHIDDFRALQLTEVLAALRMDGRQIVCAVEDSALAELLCRRLGATNEGDGRRYDFEILPGGSAGVAYERIIPSTPSGVLRREYSKSAS